MRIKLTAPIYDPGKTWAIDIDPSSFLEDYPEFRRYLHAANDIFEFVKHYLQEKNIYQLKGNFYSDDFIEVYFPAMYIEGGWGKQKEIPISLKL